MDYLRFAGLPFETQAAVLKRIVRQDALLWSALCAARDLDLPDWLIVSGAVYNNVWNALTGRPSGYGVKDIDLFYHDPSDLSFEAEDRVIQQASPKFEALAVPVEIRNQARVHLWYENRFGGPCPRYLTSAHALDYFAAETHAVGIRMNELDEIEVVAPFGLDHIFSFRLRPNRRLDNLNTYREKVGRVKTLWPEVQADDWEAPGENALGASRDDA